MPDQLEQLHLVPHVERRRGLVQHQHLGFLRQGPGHPHPRHSPPLRVSTGRPARSLTSHRTRAAPPPRDPRPGRGQRPEVGIAAEHDRLLHGEGERHLFPLRHHRHDPGQSRPLSSSRPHGRGAARYPTRVPRARRGRAPAWSCRCRWDPPPRAAATAPRGNSPDRAPGRAGPVADGDRPGLENHVSVRRSRRANTGTPTSAVITPTGSSAGAPPYAPPRPTGRESFLPPGTPGAAARGGERPGHHTDRVGYHQADEADNAARGHARRGQQRRAPVDQPPSAIHLRPEVVSRSSPRASRSRSRALQIRTPSGSTA